MRRYVACYGQNCTKPVIVGASFDTKVRLETGLYDAGSNESKVGFFRSDDRSLVICWKMIATDRGRWLLLIEALHILTRTGVNCSPNRFTNHVGAGSLLHCFDGARWSSSAISSSLVGLSVLRWSAINRGAINGGRAIDVDERIFNIFISK